MKLKSVLVYSIPLVLFVTVVILFWFGLSTEPRRLPSTLIDQPSPRFSATDMLNPGQPFTEADFKHKITLLAVWASWCENCALDNALLMAHAHDKHIQFYGINYKDNFEQAKVFLRKNGNPFTKIAYDETGTLAIDWGVYGTPETFIIDQQGVVRYRHAGPLSENEWQHGIQNLVSQLEGR